MGELAAGVAHEIRNPLNAIGTIIQQLDKDFEPATGSTEYHELAKLVYGEVKRINDTVQNFLRFSRPEPVQPRIFTINELFEEVKVQYSPLLSQRQITLDLQQNWQGKVEWDYNQMKQVLINLIDNARDAIEKQGQITLSLAPGETQNLILKVTDNGAGISPEIKPRIFNLYFTTKTSGTGIGLSMVQRIIQEHRGIISMESEPGKGSSFILNLPIRLT
jgi:two-component system sensor histidine kinase HydH